jgi:hypothetical protein
LPSLLRSTENLAVVTQLRWQFGMRGYGDGTHRQSI